MVGRKYKFNPTGEIWERLDTYYSKLHNCQVIKMKSCVDNREAEIKYDYIYQQFTLCDSEESKGAERPC